MFALQRREERVECGCVVVCRIIRPGFGFTPLDLLIEGQCLGDLYTENGAVVMGLIVGVSRLLRDMTDNTSFVYMTTRTCTVDYSPERRQRLPLVLVLRSTVRVVSKQSY